MVFILLNTGFCVALVTWLVTRSDKMSGQEQQLFVICAIMAIGNTAALVAVLMGWLPVRAGGGF